MWCGKGFVGGVVLEGRKLINKIKTMRRRSGGGGGSEEYA